MSQDEVIPVERKVQPSHLAQRIYRQHTRGRTRSGYSLLARRVFFEERANNLRPSHREVGDRILNNDESPQGVTVNVTLGADRTAFCALNRDGLPCVVLEEGKAEVRKFGSTGGGIGSRGRGCSGRVGSHVESLVVRGAQGLYGG